MRYQILVTIFWVMTIALFSCKPVCEGKYPATSCQRPKYETRTLSEMLKGIGLVDSQNYKMAKTDNYIYYINFEFEHTVVYHLKEPYGFANTGGDEDVFFLVCEIRAGRPYMWRAFIVPFEDDDNHIRKLFLVMEKELKSLCPLTIRGIR